MSVQTFIIIAFVVMLAVLGHTVWHHEAVAALNVLSQVFAGAHTTG